MAYKLDHSNIIACVGDNGTGKTLFLTAIAFGFAEENLNVYSNFKLIGINYHPITFKILADLPDNVKDGIILLDEAQMGLDAYKWFDKQSASITKLLTQLRKRNLEIMYSTQSFPMVNYRLRNLTEFIFFFEAGRDSKNKIIGGTSLISISDRKKKFSPAYKQIVFDGRSYFNKYDTEEIIENE